MKPVIAALVLSMISATVSAQSLILPPRVGQMPRTTPWTDEKGVTLGTVTFSGDRMYFRDHNGKHVTTVVINAKGMTYYDPSGKLLRHVDGYTTK